MITIFDKAKFGTRVKYFREKQGYTQLQFSELADISNPYLINIESGKNNPSIDVIVSILNALKIDYEMLMNENEYEEILKNNILDNCKIMTSEELMFFENILENMKG